MTNSYTGIIKQEGEWWIGWVEEVPGVNAQERSRDELLVSLKEALDDILELNRAESRQSAVAPFEVVTLTA